MRAAAPRLWAVPCVGRPVWLQRLRRPSLACLLFPGHGVRPAGVTPAWPLEVACPASAAPRLLLLQYGEDPAGPAGAVLNYPMAALAAFRPALPSLTTESVVPHILRLRDDGALQPVLAGGRRTSPPAAPIGGASPPAPTPPRPAAQRRQGAARHTPAVPASPPVELARAAAPTGPSPRALPASPAAPAEGAPAGAAAPAAGTAATAATAAAAPRPAVHPAQAGHAPVQEAGQPERQPADALGGSGEAALVAAALPAAPLCSPLPLL